MNFEMSVTGSTEKKALSRKNNPLKIPIFNVGNPDNLNLTGVVKIRAGEAIRIVLRHGIKDLRHGSGVVYVGRTIKKFNTPKSCKLSS